MSKAYSDLLHGTLDMLILRTLAGAPMHGWAISRWIRRVTDGVLEVNQGSLYPALYRLEDRDWITAEWGRADNGREVKVYSLTPKGSRQLEKEGAGWKEFVTAVTRVMETAG